jgi:aminoglycoside phosphotransferase (APT) family kinase protein
VNAPLDERVEAARNAGLHEALDRLLAGGRGLEIVESREVAYRSTHPLVRLRVRSADAGERWVVRKDLSREAAVGAERDPRREIDVYRELLSQHDLGAPAYLGSVVEPERGRFWLFLEDVEGTPLWQEGDFAFWFAAAARLAELHERFRDRVEGLPARLLRYDGDRFRRWLDRARKFHALRSERRYGGDVFDDLERSVELATARLEALPPTFLHGEYYPSNLLVEAGAERRPFERLRLLDWERAGVGPAAIDLAALTAGGWRDDERVAIATAYRDALPAGARAAADRWLPDLDRFRLLIAVQWMGWRRRWAPPSHQVHDWLDEARTLSRGGRGPVPWRALP